MGRGLGDALWRRSLETLSRLTPSKMLMDASFRTLQRIKIVLILGVMLAFVHDSAAKDLPGWNGITGWNGNNVAMKEQNLVDTDDGPSNGALFLATLDSLLDVDESVEFAGDGDDAEDSSKFFSFVELPEGWTEGKSGR